MTIRIKTHGGKTVRTLLLRGCAVNKLLTASFRCIPVKGAYTFFVYGTDAAGNPHTRVASNTLVVW